jgi:putative salt-induced outer membrane protein YdiY
VRVLPAAALALALLLGALPSHAQQPAAAQPSASPAPPTWSGSISAGISFTSGNRSTSNFNASFDLARDPKKRNIFKADSLYLRGKSESNVTGDQFRFGLYDEYRYDARFFVFGQARYLYDRFKDIDYLVAPSTGMGYKIYDTPASSLGIAAGLGGVWERDRGRGASASGSLTLDQKLSQKISSNASIAQSLPRCGRPTGFATPSTRSAPRSPRR